MQRWHLADAIAKHIVSRAEPAEFLDPLPESQFIEQSKSITNWNRRAALVLLVATVLGVVLLPVVAMVR